MKIADVKIGQTYLTKISGFQSRVVVHDVTEDFKGRRIFLVARPGEERRLRRSAAALHAMPEPRKPASEPPATV
jgi:hypothetical protein